MHGIIRVPDADTGKFRYVSAHRFMYELVNGITMHPLQKVSHACGVPLCVNPHHLESPQYDAVTPDAERMRIVREELSRRRPESSGDHSVPSAACIDRLWAKIAVKGDDECWIWQGFRNRSGYGTQAATIDGTRKLLLAHRMVYQLAYGPIADGLVVMHSCDNRQCCNFHHLSTGTNIDNLLDASRKGRLNHHMLTESEVIDILKDAETPNRVLSSKYGITATSIKKIKCGLTWPHLFKIYGKQEDAVTRRQRLKPCSSMTKGLSARDAQSLGGAFSAELRRSGTLSRITDAIAILKASGVPKVRCMDIVNHSGVGRRTVTRYNTRFNLY